MALLLIAACTRVPNDVGTLKYNTVTRKMVYVSGGTFQMGQTGVATPVLQVTVSSFLIDNTDVTQGDYLAVMGVNPSYFIGDSLVPVDQETWNDAVLYCNARSKRAGLDTVYSFTSLVGMAGNGCDSLGGLTIDYSKKGYRLPTEAEWEYACRAGSTTLYYWGDNPDRDYCWDTINSGLGPQPVARKIANQYGLYDMSGEVWQWCNDWYGVYPSTNQTDPTGPVSGTKRVLRGGAWYSHDYLLYSAYRSGNVSGKQFFDVGFRCVLQQSVQTPVPISPANGATQQAQTLTLVWQSVNFATTYRVQVSTNNRFDTIVVEDSTLTAASRTIGALAAGTTYYWRVLAKNADGVSTWSQAWSFTTAAPLVREMVLVKGGTFQMGQTGIAVPVRQVMVSSFQIDNTDMTQGDYLALMRVNPSYFGGDSLMPVMSVTWYDAVLCCNTRSKRAGLDTVYSYTFMSGLAGDGCDSLGNLAIDYTKKGYRLPTEAEWEFACRAGSATRYYWGDTMDHTYCWDTVNSGLAPQPVGRKLPNALGLYDMSGNVWQWCNDWYGAYSSASQTDPTGQSLGTNRILRGGSWYSHDNALYSAYRAENVLGKQFFDVGFRCVLQEMVQTPMPVAPAYGAIGQALMLTLTWSTVDNATGYRVQISTDSTFAAPPVKDSMLTSATITVSGLAGGVTYYWRARATVAGGASAYCAAWRFTTLGTSLQMPTLLSPANASTGVSSSPVLTWTTVSGASAYHVQVSSSSTFGVITAEDSTLTAASWTAVSLASGTTYYWRVEAKSAGNWSAWSSAWGFTVALLATPVLSSPANHATGTTPPAMLTWSTVTGATSYRVQVSTDSTFAALSAKDSTLTSATMLASGLAVGATYYWHAQAKNVSGTSAWSSTWSFTTAGTLRPPTLTSPASGATGVSVTPTLAWSTVTGATSYRVQVSTDSLFDKLLTPDSTLTSATMLVSGLAVGTTYYWHAQAKNASGTSAWSSAWSFTTAGALAAPALAAPANGATGVSVTPALTWSAVSGATTYHVQVSANNVFSSIVAEDSTLTSASKTISSLATGFVYYWRVQAKNANGTSAWSAAWSFTTAALASPALVSPANGATGQSQALMFTWSAVSGATAYHLQVSADSLFAFVYADDSGLTSTSHPVLSIPPGVISYWRTQAENATGVSSWTTTWSFTTRASSAPAVPSLVSPANGSANQSTTLALSWTAVSGAATYYAQISTGSSFGVVFAQDSTLTADSMSLSGLAPGTTYYWRARAKNSGGTSGWSSIWIFTTGTSAWVTKASMPTGRTGMGIAVVNNLIYVFGGADNVGPTATLDVYDPGTDTWSARPDMPSARIPGAAAVNDEIYVIGGDNIGTTVQQYDPAAGTWTAKASMPTERQPGMAVVDLKVYAIGGYNNITGSLGTNEVYDPSLDIWTSKADMIPRNGASIAAANGAVYAIGGEYSPNNPYSLVQKYDPSADAWTTEAGMPTPRRGAAAATVNNKIYVIGGQNSSYTVIPTVEQYNPTSNTWATKTSMPSARAYAGAAVVNGKLYIIGGSDNTNLLTPVEVYDPSLDP
jgi:formylglycine-generating enzyme required for sulfatase activity/N-acetylneuraminic acid mutarotase